MNKPLEANSGLSEYAERPRAIDYASLSPELQASYKSLGDLLSVRSPVPSTRRVDRHSMSLGDLCSFYGDRSIGTVEMLIETGVIGLGSKEPTSRGASAYSRPAERTQGLLDEEADALIWGLYTKFEKAVSSQVNVSVVDVVTNLSCRKAIAHMLESAGYDMSNGLNLIWPSDAREDQGFEVGYKPFRAYKLMRDGRLVRGNIVYTSAPIHHEHTAILDPRCDFLTEVELREKLGMERDDRFGGASEFSERWHFKGMPVRSVDEMAQLKGYIIERLRQI